MTLQQARSLAKKNESKKRFAHTLNVEKMAVALAMQYGADPDKAALAALLHDTAKEFPKAEMLRILKENAIIAGDTKNSPTSVWHGVCAAILAQTQWGITDPEVLSAIACHTTGKPNMGLLDKIIYLADMLCEERDFAGIKELRTLARQDLDAAMLACLAHTMHFVAKSGKTLDPISLAAYQDYAKKRGTEK
ncbi:MAG: bis(5'-nucleosyl)-tetraphosphatase (symmetrical) YqeK [Faecalibacterium sp.]